ncbi:MAG TPA: long-chain-acyl-CoA synthetase [Caulobacteraceae bacterium]
MWREARYLTGLIRTLLRVRSIEPASTNLLVDDVEAAVDRWADRLAIRFEGAELTYRQFDSLADRFCAWAGARGLERGQSVAILLPNRLEYLPLWLGLAKRGVVAALINYQLTGEALRHCLELSQARLCFVDASTRAAFAAAAPEGMAAVEIDTELAGLDPSARRPPATARAGMTARDTALLIFTSGTTGLPKAAPINHVRAQLYMRGFAGATNAKPTDRVYVTLPLYHATGGLCAAGAALLNGAAILLRRGFSASHFWADIAAEKASMFVYVGEMCRYLIAQPSSPAERAGSVRLAFGNGLSEDIWPQMRQRFGIERILEFYGSTEGNVSLFNFDGGEGACGRIPFYLAPLFNVAVVRFDAETDRPVRNRRGRCVRARAGEVGECLGQVHDQARSAYSGYVDAAASEQKLLRNAFRSGDAWFQTGDLMRRDRHGYFYFVDRVGDTFRWKGENVSASEVERVLAQVPGVSAAAVYGVKVPHHDGRAGMAAIVAAPGLDLDLLAQALDRALPPYAQPLFLREVDGLELTGTFKTRKQALAAAGFDPAACGGRLWLHDRALGYVRLSPHTFGRIQSGEERL